MKPPAFGTVAFGLVALAAVLLAVIGAPADRPAPAGISPTAAPAPAASVAANGFALASAAVQLPDDAGTYPAGPHADAIDAHCTACHSASMVLTQPPLSAAQWTAEVTKMREVYKAPVPEAAVPDIIAYLTAMADRRAAPTTGKAPAAGAKAGSAGPGTTG